MNVNGAFQHGIGRVRQNQCAKNLDDLAAFDAED